MFAVLYTIIYSSVCQRFSSQYWNLQVQLPHYPRIQILFITDFVGLHLQTSYVLNTTSDGPVNEQKETLEQEIQVLKCIQCTDKSDIPEELKYRDRGYMYFPSKDFLSFLRGLDNNIV